MSKSPSNAAVMLEVVVLGLFFVVGGIKTYNHNKKQEQMEKDRVSYMENNQPYLKDGRGQVQFQINAANQNIKRLEDMALVYKEESSKAEIGKKIEEIKLERDRLNVLLSKIDTELERGMLYKQFDHMDNGGLKAKEMKDLDKEVENAVRDAKKANQFTKIKINAY